MSRKSKASEFVKEGWDIQITGRNVLVTDPMKDYAMEKISKIELFSKRIVDVNVVMDIQKLEHRLDIIVKVDNLKIKSHAASDNMYSSIDIAIAKLLEQLRRYKTRIQDHQSISHEEVAMKVEVYASPTDEELVNDDIEAENANSAMDRYTPHKIVAQETKPLKTLTNNEAIVKMELSGDAFLIFRSEEDRKMKVIYKRSDGHYGIIIAPEEA
ncbi:MAG: ribosome-associated translation inhibitor RaiA [Parachlamydia sp.]|nr:ribosome-associated translation inhibitor RaiA [Parachlamydia sp.]